MEFKEEMSKSNMPIMTPIRPYQCTTFGLTKSALNKIQSELIRARDIFAFVKNKREIC